MLTASARDSQIQVHHVESSNYEGSSAPSSQVMRAARSTLGFLQIFRSIRARMKLQTVDVVHIASSGAWGHLRDIGVALLCRGLKRPVILHLHHGRWSSKTHSAQASDLIGMNVLARFTSSVVVLDAKSQVQLQDRYPALDVRIVPNSASKSRCPRPVVDAHDHLRLRPFVLYLGRIADGKGIHELLDAWQTLNSNDWSLVLCGSQEGRFGRRLAERATELPRVEVLGPIPHESTNDLVRASELVVLVSHSEGFPMSILEAMAEAKPVVATRVGALDALIDEIGLAVEVGNSTSIAAALRELTSNEALRIKLGSRARELFLEQFTEDRNLERLKKIWRVK